MWGFWMGENERNKGTLSMESGAIGDKINGGISLTLGLG